MPSYHNFEWEGFVVKAEPSGIRRLFRFLPYFTGSEPTFKITVYSKRGKVLPFQTTLNFYEPDYTVRGKTRMLSSYDRPVTNISENIKVHPIGVSGDHRFQITLEFHAKGSYMRDPVTFTAISGDKTTMTILSALLVIFGGIVGGLITKFLFG